MRTAAPAHGVRPEPPPALLVFEDGSAYRGHSFGASGTAFDEGVFNTAMTGYQEIVTDPSYRRQVVTMTGPQIGNWGFSLVATEGTADLLQRADVHAEVVGKLSSGRTRLLHMVGSSAVTLILNTPSGARARDDGYHIRQAAIAAGVPVVTTLFGIMAAIQSIEALGRDSLQVTSLQDHFGRHDVDDEVAPA